MAQGVGAAAYKAQAEIMDRLSKQVGRTTQEEVQVMRAGKIATGEGKQPLTLTAEAAGSLRKAGGALAVDTATTILASQDLGLQLGRATSEEERSRIYEEYAGKKGAARDMMSNMDIKSLRALGSTMAGTEEGDVATGMIMRGQAMKAGVRRKGAFGAMADQLGVRMDKSQLDAMKGKSPEAQAAMLAREPGVGGDQGFVSALTEAAGTIGKKGGEVRGADLLSRAREHASADTRTKLEAYAKGQASPEEKILDALKLSNDHLKIMADAVPKTESKLSAISANSSKWFPADGEKS
jgi:hypothetical protein